MYKVLIVDDESFVIKNLIASVNWNEYGFELVGQANDGIEAMDAILSLKPDLVFTDLKMPGMSGLELIKAANENALKVLFVVISGNAEFTYIHKAMNYGALGYCLKPLEDNEIITALLRAKVKLDESKLSLESTLLELLEDKSDIGRNKAREIFNMLGFELGNDSEFLVMASVGSGSMSLPSHIKCINLRLGNNKKVYLFEFDQANDIRTYLNETMFPKQIRGIGLGAELCSFDNIHQEIEKVIVAACQFFINGAKGCFGSGSLNQEVLNASILELERAIDSKESPQIQKALELMSHSGSEFDIRQALRIYNMVMSYLYRLDSVKYEDYAYSYERLINQFDDLQQMLAYLKELLNKQSNSMSSILFKEVRNETFKSILQYVDEHYAKDISIQSISHEFKINPNYVSQLFKKGLNMTFTDYLARMRISYACNLLKTTNWPVNDIASKAGYVAYYYFTRVFKKATGMTPTNFRYK
jgi:two-component system response regulator YesN